MYPSILPNILWLLPSLAPDCLGPVSYTHLDVYKRQTLIIILSTYITVMYLLNLRAYV